MDKKILIIDDELDVMKMLVYRLKAKGYEIVTASNAKEGISTAKKETPDLIILDYRLPDAGPLEVPRKLKEEEALRNTPVILVTASIDGIAEKAKECNAVDYIPKPIDPDELYKKIEKHIK